MCGLVKSLYGLKWVPKQWHEKFDNAVILNGFRINEQKMCVVKDMDLELMSEKCMYVKDTTNGCPCLSLCLYAYYRKQ